MTHNKSNSKNRKWTDTLSLFKNNTILEYVRIGSESTTMELLFCIYEARFSYSFYNFVCTHSTEHDNDH